ncbi:G protein-coupled glucose receptor regulating Gpa2-domain-containing protein [Flagelloscypha sp. PMI_526]|nr:G protein-coupled glucose receptor regulating Gpa2-domain-containing protein [Flagelloscypha sp. PMI_526]
MGLTHYEVALAGVNLTAGLLSTIGTSFIIVCYFIRHLHAKAHFRHQLILNLVVADFVNSINASVSGSWILAHKRRLEPGGKCTANAFISQVSVQATDCAVLAIAIVTVYSIVNVKRLIRSRRTHHKLVFFTCAATWLLPLTTASIALGKNWYGPVSGNWCWLISEPFYIRYVLTHGWRFVFFIAEISLYTYLFIYTRRMNRVRSLYACHKCASSNSAHSSGTSATDESQCTLEECPAHISCNNCSDPHSKEAKNFSTMDQAESGAINCITTFEVTKIMLMNAYPLSYMILWIPGIINRIIEATGHSSHVSQLLQASTQFIGLANG